MTVEERAELQIPRGAWVRYLHASGATAVRDCVDGLRDRLQVHYRAVPRSGLGMLRLREPSLGEHFNLGEFPLSVAEVSVRDATGAEAQGAAQVMVDDEAVATALAVCDAVLAGGLDGVETVRELLRRGREAVDQEAAVRAGLLRSTTVDFDLLDEVDEEDD